jgi:hypothetical protein
MLSVGHVHWNGCVPDAVSTPQNLEVVDEGLIALREEPNGGDLVSVDFAGADLLTFVVVLDEVHQNHQAGLPGAARHHLIGSSLKGE